MARSNENYLPLNIVKGVISTVKHIFIFRNPLFYLKHNFDQEDFAYRKRILSKILINL